MTYSLFKLLFKRTGYKQRPEDQYLGMGADPVTLETGDEVSETMKVFIRNRLEVVNQTAKLAEEKEAFEDLKDALDEEMLHMTRNAVLSGRPGLSAKEEIDFGNRYHAAMREGKRRIYQARAALRSAKANTKLADIKLKHELKDGESQMAHRVQKLNYVVRTLTIMKQKRAMAKKAKTEMQLNLLGRHERVVAEAEYEEVQKLYFTLDRMLYNYALSPTVKRFKDISFAWMLPPQVRYIFFVFLIGFILGYQYYAFLFSIRMNMCAKCTWYPDAGDEGTCGDPSLDDDFQTEICGECS